MAVQKDINFYKEENEKLKIEINKTSAINKMLIAQNEEQKQFNINLANDYKILQDELNNVINSKAYKFIRKISRLVRK